MKKKLILLIILLNFILSLITFFLILNYFDPYTSVFLATAFLAFIFVSALSSFVTLLLYLFKKIYYRGDVGVYHVKSSFRQGLFFSLFFLGMIVFQSFGISFIVSFILFGILFGFTELFIQNLN